MTIVSLDDLMLVESPIQYRRQYTATAHLDYGANRSSSAAIAFSLEHTAVGQVEVRVRLQDEVNYPLVPLFRELKRHIHALEREGRLP